MLVLVACDVATIPRISIIYKSSQHNRSSSGEIYTTNMRTICRWTDDDLLSVLIHANGDFTLAVEAIFRHEAAGRSPEELIRLLSGGGGGGEWRERHFDFAGSPPILRERRHSYSEGSAGVLRSAGLGGGCGGLRRMRSEGAPVTSCEVVPPPPSPTNVPRFGDGSERPILDQRYTYSEAEGQGNCGPSSTGEGCALSGETYVPGGLQTMIRCPPSRIGQSISSSTAFVDDSAQTQRRQQLDHQNENQTLCVGRRQRQHDYDTVKASKSKHQQTLENWDMQSAIEASLKQTKNTAQDDAGDDMDDHVAVSYAIKVSKETFDEAYRKQEMRDALEKRMIKISLAASLSDPVKKSEEELIGEAMKRSLADPIRKSEDQLIEEAREKSLQDMRRLETIIKSEEEMMEAAKQKSLCTMPPDEELIEAVKRQSLNDARKDPLWLALEKSLSESLKLDTQRRMTSSTHRMSFGDDDSLDCSSFVEEFQVSRHDSPLMRSHLDWMDRKMPALALPGDQNCGEEQTQHSNRLRSKSNCSSSSSVGVEAKPLPSSGFDSSLDEGLDSDSDLMDRKMPARVLPAVPNGDEISSASESNLEIASGLLSLADHVREYDKRAGASK